ncbi:MAG: glycosyltransferase, partial [Chloroflexota bacterium]|nr:glycosyltransferase [Chloroflexota bacterium]
MDLQPFVTIIMPIRNEGGFIARSLGAVLGQDYPADRIEVLVADGLSTDSTRAVVADLALAHPNVRLLDNPGQIVSTGLNRALPLARGDVIIRVDGHCEIAPDYVRRCVAHLRADGVDGVGGPIETVADTPAGATIALAMGSPFGVGGSAFRTVRDRAL